MKFLITLLIMSTLVYADDVINPTPSKLNTEANAALVEYHRSVDKLTDKLRADLQKAQDIATKKGDLDTAIAIKAEIGKLPNGQPQGNVKTLPKTSLITRAQADVLVGQIDTLTETEWNSLPGVTVKAEASEMTTTSIVLKTGETYVMIPNAKDRWCDLDYKGNPAQPKWTGIDANGGALVWTTDATHANGHSSAIITGEGKLSFYCNFGGVAGRAGMIRCKILKVSDK